MPFPVISNRSSFMDVDTSLLDTPNNDSASSTATTATISVTVETKTTKGIETQHCARAVQSLSTSIQSSTSSDSSSDDSSNNTLDPPSSHLQSPPLLSTECQDTFVEDLSLLDSPMPLILDCLEEDNLSATMLALYEELLPTRESYNRRMGLVHKIELLLNTEWPDRNIKANLFGSSVNDLGTNQSDVDLCITTQWNGLRNVRLLAKLFRKCGMQHVVCVPRAKVPIVRLFDSESQLACDINVNNTLALQNTKMIRTYVAIDPRVRPLAMIIKHWTKQRMLNDAADGGTLSTYTWTCMIINFLQMRQPPILPVLHQLKTGDEAKEMFCSDAEKLRGFGEANRESLGGLLYAFFRRYAIEFDYDDQVISVRHGKYLSKREKGWHIGRNKTSLCVEEPFNVTRNLGNSADMRSVLGIRMELNRALEMLVAGASWKSICSPYQVLTFGSSTSVDTTPPVYYSSTLSPSDINSHPSIARKHSAASSSSSSSTSLLTARHLQPVFLPTSYLADPSNLTELHPHERRRSMTYTQRPHDFDQQSLSYRLYTINQGFHRRNGTSLPALMENLTPSSKMTAGTPILSYSSLPPTAKTPVHTNSGPSNACSVHGQPSSSTSSPSSSLPQSHQAVPLPSEQHRTVDAIFARYHRHQQPYHSSSDITLISSSLSLSPPSPAAQIQGYQHQQQLRSLRGGNVTKRSLSSTQRRSSQNNGSNNASNPVEWPSISQLSSSLSSCASEQQQLLSGTSRQQQRRRRWSTTKKSSSSSSSIAVTSSASASGSSSTIEIKLPMKERTLADIVKLDGNKPLPTTNTHLRRLHQSGTVSARALSSCSSSSSSSTSSSLSTSTSTSSTSSTSSAAVMVSSGTHRRVKQQHRHHNGNTKPSSPSKARRKTEK